MAERQVIDIGIQGNDGTGDSIRESFRKVNDNFSQLFAIFGASGTISFTNLSDAPSSYGSNQVIISNADGDRLVAKSLTGGTYVTIDNSDPNEIVISASSGMLVNDPFPRLSVPLNAGGWAIGNLADPEEGITRYNTVFSTTEDISSFAIPRGYGDRRYFRPNASKSLTGLQLRVRSEPESNDQYSNTIANWVDGYAIITSHGYTEDINGFAVIYNRTGTTSATGLSNGSRYYLRYVDSSRLAVYTTRANAIAGGETGKIFVNLDPVVSVEARGVETFKDSGWDSTLSGRWLSDEVLPRNSVVRRQGDTMTGLLTLSGNPTDNFHAATKQYADSVSVYNGGTGVTVSGKTISIGQSVNTTSDVTFNNLTVSGDLVVNGTTTTINTTTLNVTDNIITLNGNVTGDPGVDAGIEVNRGTGENTLLKWNETTDTWQQTRNGTNYYDIPISTDELSEGTNNKYFTDARSYTKIKSVLQEGTQTQLVVDDVAETITINVVGGTGGFDLSNNTTDDLAEGTTNLYYTGARARASVSAANSVTGYGSLAYDNSTGKFTYTKVTAADVRGAFSAGTGITIASGQISTSITQYTDALAATAAKSALSAANSGTGYGSLSYSEGTFTYAKVTAADIRGAFSAGTDISITDGTIAVSSSTTATNSSLVKRTSTGNVAANTFTGSLLTNVLSLTLGASGQTLTASQITGNIITVVLTDNATLTLPSAADSTGRILIIRNQSSTLSLTVDSVSTIVTLTPAAPVAQIACDGISWFVV
jgi:hypothetical protein